MCAHVYARACMREHARECMDVRGCACMQCVQMRAVRAMGAVRAVRACVRALMRSCVRVCMHAWSGEAVRLALPGIERRGQGGSSLIVGFAVFTAVPDIIGARRRHVERHKTWVDAPWGGEP